MRCVVAKARPDEWMLRNPLRVAEALLASAEGNHHTAVAGLERLLSEVEPGEGRRVEMMVRCELAATLERAGRPRQAVRTMVPALHLAAQAGAVATILAAVLRRYAEIRPLADNGPDGLPDTAFLDRVLGMIDAKRTGGTPKSAGSRTVADHSVGAVTGSAPPAPHTATHPAEAASVDDRVLNDREREVVECLEGGLTNQQISQRLSISVNTVKWHLKNIYAKLGATSRLAAVAAYRSRAVSG